MWEALKKEAVSKPPGGVDRAGEGSRIPRMP